MTTYNEAGQTYEDVDFLYDGMPIARAFSVLAGSMSAAEDISPYVKWDTLQATDNGTNGRGLISMRFERTMAQLPTVIDQGVIRVIDHALHEDIARGIIRSRKPHSVPGYDAVDIIADDVGGLVDDTFIASVVRPAETMVNRITYLWQTYGSPPLDLDDLSFVAAIGGTLLAQNFAGVTLRQAIEATINQVTGADYYVDSTGKLHVFTSESNPAPKDIDADAPGASEIAPQDLDIDYDSNAYANRVYIQGATPAGSGFFRDEAAITAVDGMVRTAVLQAPDCETPAMATALANMYLGRVSSAKPRGTFSTTKVDGWRAGQNVLVTSAAHGLSAQSFRIARVTTSIVRPGASGMVRKYQVEFGGSRAGGSGVRSEGIGSGQVVSGQLGGGSNVYVNGDGVQVTDLTNVRVYMGKLPGGDYGLQVLSSDGTTVIIDGSSNQFKIAATGTMSKATVSGDIQVSATVTLTGLGALPTTPAHTSFVSDENVTTAIQFVGLLVSAGSKYVAATSGGSPTVQRLVPDSLAYIATSLNGSAECVVRLTCSQVYGFAWTFYGRYYVLQEAAL